MQRFYTNRRQANVAFTFHKSRTTGARSEEMSMLILLNLEKSPRQTDRIIFASVHSFSFESVVVFRRHIITCLRNRYLFGGSYLTDPSCACQEHYDIITLLLPDERKTAAVSGVAVETAAPPVPCNIFPSKTESYTTALQNKF